MLTHEQLLGRTVTDKLTSFKGIVSGYIYYMTGCNQCLVVPRAKDDKLGEASWFDVQRLEVEPVPVVELDNSRTPGFMTPPPPEH